jgi:hypothetical protein
MSTHQHNFAKYYEFSGKPRTWSLAAILIGLVAVAIGFLIGGHEGQERIFLNLLQMSYYFTCVCAGSLFFVALQYVAQAGWPASLIRIPEAFAKVLPIAGKSAYLNVPFFLARLVILLGIYSFFAMKITKFSNDEDSEGGLANYNRNVKYATIFMVIFGFTTPIFAFDTIMSLEAHWFSTMFGWYNFAGMWVVALCAITLSVILLKKAGHFTWVNENHLHDLGKFIFAFSIFWTYIWFGQFLFIMLISRRNLFISINAGRGSIIRCFG